MTVMQALGVSVCASVLAVFIIGITKLLSEWLAENYGHKLAWAHIPDVRGSWLGEFTDHQGNRLRERLVLKQTGSNLGG